MKVIIIFATLLALYLDATEAAEKDEISPKLLMNAEEPNKNITVLEKWERIEKTIKDAARQAVRKILPIIVDNSERLNLSRECVKNSMHLILGLKNIKPWAVRFLDSSAKTIDGLMAGTLSSFGSYDECLDTEVKSTRLQDKGKLLYRGQYCMTEVKLPLPPKKKKHKTNQVIDELKNFSERDTAIGEAAKLAHFAYFFPFQLGICTPSGCSKEDINKIVNLLAKSVLLNATVKRCEIKEENQFTPVVKAVIICFSLVGFLLLVGTLIDIYSYYKKAIFRSKLIRMLVAFSFVTNFKKFIYTDAPLDNLSCLNGVRFLSITWVIIGHSYFTLNFQMFQGFMKAPAVTGDFAFQAIINGSFAVDTFFFIGGLLVCFVTLKKVRDQGQKLNVIFYILHRVWRIVPIYSFTIMSVFIINLLGSGPIWHDATYKHVRDCYNNWWTNLLFINNFYDTTNMCLLQSWYLASDFQLYVAALLILLPMIRRPKLGISLAFLTVIASVLYAGTETYVKNYPPTSLATSLDKQEFNDYLSNFYFKPFLHCGPYCIGLLAGYLLATKPDLKIPPSIQVIGWSLAFTFNFSVLYGVVEWNKGVEPTLWATILYASLNRTAWTLGVAWMIVCCATGHGGVINYILSWKIFIPLGRLTYAAYLFHPIVQLTVIGNIRTTIQFDHFLIVWLFFGHLCATYGIAFAGSMLIEAPFMALEKIFLPTSNRNVESNPLVIENNNLKGDLKPEKENDKTVVLPMTEENFLGVDSKIIVHRL